MINTESIKHILISRVDNIGDVVLTLPLAAELKQHFPNTKMSFLSRDYASAIIKACPYIDEFISWDSLIKMKKKEAIGLIQSENIDCVIHAFPKKEIASLMRKAKIPLRIGTSRRWYHWLTCTDRVKFSRAKSDLHEAQLNMQLLSAFDLPTNHLLCDLVDLIELKNDHAFPERLKQFLSPNKFNLIIHPFSNGNTREWPVSHFNALIRQLPLDKINILVTGSQKEKVLIKARIKSQCPEIQDVSGLCNLNELLQLMRACDGLIANSTGPLHMAAAVGIHALGLYPATHGMNPDRWAPIGKQAEFLMADPGCQMPRCRDKRDCLCMESITVNQARDAIVKWLEK